MVDPEAIGVDQRGSRQTSDMPDRETTPGYSMSRRTPSRLAQALEP